MANSILRILVIGAHPDDCEYKAGGVAALYREQGHVVRFVSVTNGDAGHHVLFGAELASRRLAETTASGAVCGVEYEVLAHHDGQLEPTIANRFEMIALIRRFRPDLILTHRPNDYHPDHRVTSQLVCDAAYMVTVPPLVPTVPHLAENPVIAYLSDEFQQPYAFIPTVVVDVSPVFEQIVEMLAAHESQFFEWLPYNQRILDQVPQTVAERRAWLAEQARIRLSQVANRFRAQLIERYGPIRGSQVQLAEAFEGCEYGSPLTPENAAILFPFE
ncbi:MAG: GlcNAc-PI de-N-acetylase [Planctomycetaceae bacterium]|nr:GlcNAc-PI de-N-acetylase [Planctomycetaceae bacterium]